VIVITEVNGTSTTVVLVCWLLFKEHEGKERESEKERVNTPISDNRVGEPGLDLVYTEGGGQWMRIVSQSAPDRGVDNIPRWTLCSRTEET